MRIKGLKIEISERIEEDKLHRLGCTKEQHVWLENERTKEIPNKQKRAVLRGTFREE